MQRVGLLLAGCGAHDGSDIHEVVLAALALERARAQVVYLATAGPQGDVVDHATGLADQQGPARDVFVESARLARGRLSLFDAESAGDLSALVIAGGLGVVKNLFVDVLVAGRRPSLKPAPRDLLVRLHEKKIPMGGVGLAHLVLEAVAGELGVEPLSAPADRAILDPARRVGWAPGFLTAQNLDEAARGIDELVAGVMSMTGAAPAARRGPRGEGKGER